MEALVKVATVFLVLCTACALTGALQLELASVVSVLLVLCAHNGKGYSTAPLIYMCKCDQ